MKTILLFLLIPLVSLSQVQIGGNIDGEAADDLSGRSISLSSNGSIVAISAARNDGNGSDSGHVRIYENQGNVWTQIGQDINGEATNDVSGTSISLSSNGSIIAIGALGNDENGSNSGHVRIYENQGNVWTQIGQDINGEAAGDASGTSVSLSSSGNIVAIGATKNDGNGSNSGHVRVYENQGGVWTQIGQDINGEAADDLSGGSISLSSNGSIIAIGERGNDENGDLAGQVRIYENQGGVWTQIGQDIHGGVAKDLFGSSVSLSSNGNIIAIGAPENDSDGAGYVQVYENQGGVWTQIGEDIHGEAIIDRFGGSVSLSSDGSIIVIGAFANDENGDLAGKVRIYKNQGGIWTQIGQDIYGEAAGDRCGKEVSISSDGSVIAIGANYNDGNGSDSGHVRIYDINDLLSIEEHSISKLRLYPNPTKNYFKIELGTDRELQQITIYNNLGQFITDAKDSTVDISNLTKGIYYIKIKTNKERAVKKLIIK